MHAFVYTPAPVKTDALDILLNEHAASNAAHEANHPESPDSSPLVEVELNVGEDPEDVATEKVERHPVRWVMRRNEGDSAMRLQFLHETSGTELASLHLMHNEMAVAMSALASVHTHQNQGRPITGYGWSAELVDGPVGSARSVNQMVLIDDGHPGRRVVVHIDPNEVLHLVRAAGGGGFAPCTFAQGP